MMKTRTILTAVSAIALLGLSPAMAQTSVGAGAEAQATVKNDNTGIGNTLEKTWEKTKDVVKETTGEVTEATKNAYEDVKFSLLASDPNAAASEVTISAKMTADGMLGEPVLNSNNERIATLKDIIIDENGMAQMVVVSDAEFIDVGAKEAAFDYSMVTQREPEGDFITPLTEDTIDKAKTFSYDQADATKEGTRVMPSMAYSVKKLLESDVVDMENKKIGEVENLTFKNGRADRLVVGFDKVLGMGGDAAGFSMTDVKILREDDDSVKIQLSAAQAGQLEAFRQKASN